MKMEMMGAKVFKATLDGRVLWDLRGGKDMHRSMWEIPVLPWKEAAACLAAEAVREGHASHVTSGGGGDGSDGGLLVHGGGALPSLPFHSAVGQSSDPVELVHVDLVGPMKVKGDGGALYSMTMVDVYTRLTWSFPLANTSDAARVIIEEWLPMVERESGKRVKAICSDRGGEFLGAEFRRWLKRHGIKQQITTAYTPQSNGVAEKANRTIIEGGRTILVDSGQHWIPMEKWSGKTPLVDMLRVFGCMGLVHVPKEKRDKLQAAAVWAVHLDEEIYMKQPEGCDDGSGRVCRLNKAIYGLKQAPRCWYARLVEALEALGFKVSGCDKSLFTTKGEEEKVFLLVYVDDILLFSPSLERIKEVQVNLKETFQCKTLGPVGYYFGFHAERDEVKGWLRLHQHKYLAAMGEKYGLAEGRSVKTPLPSGFQLHLDEEEGEVLDYELQRRFQSMVGSLMYASDNTRPDIAFSVSQLARVVSRPLQELLDAAERLVRYCMATSRVGLQYSVHGQLKQKGSGGGEHKDWCTCKAWALVPLVLHRCDLGK
ncbi:unnamed protein product [Closterium sp. NIES-53]